MATGTTLWQHLWHVDEHEVAVSVVPEKFGMVTCGYCIGGATAIEPFLKA